MFYFIITHYLASENVLFFKRILRVTNASMIKLYRYNCSTMSLGFHTDQSAITWLSLFRRLQITEA